MENKELQSLKEKYNELLRDLHENIRDENIKNVKQIIDGLIKKTYLLKRKLEMSTEQ